MHFAFSYFILGLARMMLQGPDSEGGILRDGPGFACFPLCVRLDLCFPHAGHFRPALFILSNYEAALQNGNTRAFSVWRRIACPSGVIQERIATTEDKEPGINSSAVILKHPFRAILLDIMVL